MPTNADADLTLPSVVATLPGVARERQLVLTLIFHPDITRIGARAQVPVLAGAPPWVLGRRSPSFSSGLDSHAFALGERHVSRQAVALVAQGEGLVLHRMPNSSRCRVAGHELRESMELSAGQLEDGVAILLGHSVVLMLHRAQWRDTTPVVQAGQALCGSSARMSELREQIALLAEADVDVLIRGETGTGKELVATELHRASGRRAGPLVSINMAAIPPDLAAAALFGSERGAFTGATRATRGFFSQASGGTLFMDEIGDTPAQVQPQLLRALQQREIQAVGGAIQKVDVRVISATDGALEGEDCDFKAALRHRLGAGEVRLLPLRRHREDIGELLVHFLKINCQAMGCPGLLPTENSSPRDIAAWAGLFHSFLGYDWPGNVRELANFAGQIVVASAGGLNVPDNIRFALQQYPARRQGAASVKSSSIGRNIHEIDQAEFDNALADCGYEVANAARKLGVSRQAIYRRMGESPAYRLAGQIPRGEVERALSERGGDAGAAARDLKVSVSGLRSRLRGSGLAWF